MVKTAFNPTIADASAVAADVNSGKTFYAGARPKKTGTATLIGTETFEREAYQQLGAGASYTPAVSGIFSACLESSHLILFELLSTDTNWYAVHHDEKEGKTVIGDGTNLRFTNNSAGALEFVCTRHYVSSGTYEKHYDADLAGGGTSYAETTTGLYTLGGEVALQWDCHGTWASDDSAETHQIAVNDGASMRVYNGGGPAMRIILMRAIMT